MKSIIKWGTGTALAATLFFGACGETSNPVISSGEELPGVQTYTLYGQEPYGILLGPDCWDKIKLYNIDTVGDSLHLTGGGDIRNEIYAEYTIAPKDTFQIYIGRYCYIEYTKWQVIVEGPGEWYAHAFTIGKYSNEAGIQQMLIDGPEF